MKLVFDLELTETGVDNVAPISPGLLAGRLHAVTGCIGDEVCTIYH